MERLRALETTEVAASVDSFLVKPLCDDVNTRSLAVDAVEVTDTQLSSLHSIVMDCSRVLHVPHVPRVFVSERPELLIAVENLSDPVIVIHASFLSRFQNEREQRFLVGREFGHIMAGHVRWQTLLRGIQSRVKRTGVGAFPFKVALLPFLEWTREAEMSADNAGLICAQDITSAEMALVRLATGIDDSALHDIKVDEYLKQADSHSLSDFSGVALSWKELSKPAPFTANRISQLREFEHSDGYRRLWE